VDVGVAETEYVIAVALESLRAVSVVGLGILVVMAVAIQFDNQAMFVAIEVGDETPDGLLAAELDAREPAVAEEIP
jgi:hypothetical protein